MDYCPKPSPYPSSSEQTTDHFSKYLTLQTPRCIANIPLFLFETYYGNVPAHVYKPGDIEAFDAADTNPDGPDQAWSVHRDTVGDVELQFTVRPRKIDITTPGGLIGGGRRFLPRPAAEDAAYRHVVQWDLSCAPGSTRAVWSLGEGPGAVSRVGGSMEMINSFFMVGPIVSYPDEEIKVADPGATIYWFGSLPENIRQLNAYSTKVFPKLAAFFQVPDSSYRVFIRQELRGFGRAPCVDTLLPHEMIHSFTMMGMEIANGYDDGWYIEGIAELYSAFLPYRFGLCGKKYLRERLSSTLTTYGTSPRIEIDMLESQKDFHNDWYAELIPYARGCAYLLQDDIVIDMGLRWRRGEQLLAKDWLKYLRPYFGEPRVTQEFQNMLIGKVLDLIDAIVIHESRNLCAKTQEILEFGFDRSSIENRVVSGVVPGSRAALAGLADDDRTFFSASMDLVVEKGDANMHVSYWPQSFHKAKVWQLEESDDTRQSCLTEPREPS
ncbi:hypothetical protein BDW69DRAFT_191286 [Aspergillus filifer]